MRPIAFALPLIAALMFATPAGAGQRPSGDKADPDGCCAKTTGDAKGPKTVPDSTPKGGGSKDPQTSRPAR